MITTYYGSRRIHCHVQYRHARLIDWSKWFLHGRSNRDFNTRSVTQRGPLLSIRGFHPACLKWCLMHTLNLGILYTCNGGSLQLNRQSLFVAPCVWVFGDSVFFTPGALAKLGFIHWPRHVLLNSGLFGDPTVDSKRVLLHRAYIHFKNFCTAKRIYCSQPAFQEKLATWPLWTFVL